MDLARGGRPAGQIMPRKHIYDKNQEQPMTEVGLRPGPVEDVYVVLAGFENFGARDETVSFKVYVNPLMSWMWVGGVAVILGVLVSAWPRKRSTAAEARAAAPSAAQETLEELLAQRDAAFQALRDLNFDHRVGKISDEDFAVFEANLKQVAADALRALDEWEQEADRLLEGVVWRQAKARRPAEGESDRRCPECGRLAAPEDKFCASCGARLKPYPTNTNGAQ
jgi:hypothetical protein